MVPTFSWPPRRSMNANLLRPYEEPPTLADYERAAHHHHSEAFFEAVGSRRRRPANWHLKQAKRYESICRRLRMMGRTRVEDLNVYR